MKNGLIACILILTVLSSISCSDDLSDTEQVVMKSGRWFSDDAFINTPIGSDATYTHQSVIGVVRQVYEEWSMPVYRLTSDDTETVKVTNNYREYEWPIPEYAEPATADDHHLCVVDPLNTTIYEMWDADWNLSRSKIRCGALKDYSLNGTGKANPASQGVCAASFCVSAGMIVLEDFYNSATGSLDADMMIDHALTMAISGRILQQSGYSPPAERGEDDYGSGTIPCGALFALPPDFEMSSISENHQLVKSMCYALSVYGVYINDGNSAEKYNGKEVGTVRVEPGICEKLFSTSSDSLLETVQEEMYEIINQYGLYRVTGMY